MISISAVFFLFTVVNKGAILFQVILFDHFFYDLIAEHIISFLSQFFQER